MKSFDKFREECGCDKKEKKVKSKLKNKKSGNVEVMPNIPDGQGYDYPCNKRGKKL